MWKKLFILVMVLITSLCAWSADGDKFQAETPGGVMMEFKVISEAEKTCWLHTLPNKSTEGAVSVPEEVNGYKVVELRYNAFWHQEKITSISLPSTITAIGSTAFEGCISLKNINLPPLLTSVSVDYFKGCVSLNEIESQIEDPTKVRIYTNGYIYLKELAQQIVLRVPDGTKKAYLSTSEWNEFIIFEHSEPVVINYERTLTDEQGVKYQLSQSDSSFVYKICGYTEALKEQVIVPDSIGGLAVASISDYSFNNCKTLKWIHLPALVVESSNVKSFFNGCELTLSLNNKVIHTSKFENATFIKELELGADVDSLGYGAFSSCKNLTKVTFSDQTRIIGEKSFENCLSLATIELPQKLTSIGRRAFSGCSKLHWKELPTNLVSIGDYAFSGCTIDSVSVREDMELSSSSFANCTINAVSVHRKTFGQWFQNNTSIKKVYIGKEVETIGSGSYSGYTLYGCSGIEMIKVDTANIIFDSREDCNSIIKTATNYLIVGCKTSIIPKSITSIGGSAFNGCTGLTSIELPASLTSIESSAFSNCTGLTSIELPASLTSIGSSAFNGCTGLTSIELPASLTSIGSSAFKGCTGLTSIELPASLTRIESSAFSNCTNIQNVVSHIRRPFSISAFPTEVLSTATLTVPYGRTVLYRNASGWNFQTIKEMEGTYEESTFIQFADSLTKVFCVKNWDENKDGELSLYEASLVTSLENISRPNIVSFDELKYFENLSDIGTFFQSRTNLSSIALPKSVATIGTQAFYNCTALTSIQLPDSLESIGKHAFYNCKALSTIQIPESVQSLGERVFENCSGLTSATLPKGLKSIPASLFWKCSALAEVVLPDSLEIIGGAAFKECASLTQISLPEGLSVLSGGAFDGSGLKEMVLPSTLTQIGDYALAGSVIHCPIKEPISVKYPSRDARNTVLYVPEESVDAYRNASGWKDFIVIAEGNGNTDWTEGQIVVNVESAGGLRMALLERDEEEIRRLKICGPLNSVDLQYLSEGAGMISQLESIDLSDVTLVYDGGCYRDNTMADGDVMFSKDRYKFYLTEETSEKHGVSLGLSSTKTHSYYGPDLAGVFMGKSYKHIVMPRGINRAAVYTFTSCANLQEVEFVNGLKYVASSAFAGCVSLPTLNMEEVDSIGASAFSGCRTLNVENMNKVRHIGNNAFNKCDFLKGSNGVVSLPLCDSIAQYAFYGCTNIEKIEFSENLRFLGKQAFMNCASLTSVNLSNSLQALFEETFSGCTALKEVSYSDNLLKVHRNAFNNTPWDENLPVEGGVKYMGNIAMFVVDTQNAAGIREGTISIADGFNSSYLSDFSLPKSLRRIGDDALRSYNLSTLLLPEGLEEIGEEAFYNNQQLTKVTLNEKLKEAGASAFSQCSQLNIVNYNPAELQAIGLFEDCTALEKVNVGAKVRKLPENIFDGCSNLAMIKFAERTDDTPFEVGAGAFQGCSYLSSLELPSATTEIGKGAFCGCSRFKNFIVPEQVTVLNSNVFEECSSMSEIKLHGGIKIIGDRAFYRCYYLESIELSEGLDSIGEEAFYGCYPLKEITIPSTVTRIGSGAFKDCYMLQRINSRITHPMEVTGIVSLSDYIIYALYNKGMGTTACIPYRTKMYSEIILTVPAGSKKLYRQTAGWSNFANIAEEGDDMTEKNYLSPRIDRAIPASYKEYLNIYLTNDREDFTAYQFDLNIPYGIEVETDENGQYKYVMTDRNDVSHTIMVEKLERTFDTGMDRNRYRFICISAQNAAIKGTDGILLEIPLITDANMKPDSYEAKLENIIFTQQDGTENELFVSHFYINIAEVPDFTWGDANVDGAITVSDIVEVIDHILLRSRPGIFNEKAADANQDGEINISDVVKIVNLIMNK